MATPTSGVNVDQQQVQALLELLGFSVNGQLSPGILTVLAAHANAYVQATGLNNGDGIISEESVHQLVGEVLASLNTAELGLSVATTLSRRQLRIIAGAFFDARYNGVIPGWIIAKKLSRAELNTITAHVFDQCVSATIRRQRNQRVFDKQRQKVNASGLPQHLITWLVQLLNSLEKQFADKDIVLSDMSLDELIEALRISSHMFTHHGRPWRYSAASGLFDGFYADMGPFTDFTGDDNVGPFWPRGGFRSSLYITPGGYRSEGDVL